MTAGKGKKKNLLTLLGMTAALAALIAVYAVVSARQEGKEAGDDSPEEPDIVLLSAPADEIASVSVMSKEYPFTLAAGASGWEFVGDEEFDVNVSAVEAMTETLARLTAESTVLADAEDLSEYGLQEPELAVAVTMADGSAKGIRIGGRAGAGGGYYACVDGGRDVYLISENARDVFAVGRDKLLQQAAVPAFSADKVTGLKISSDVFPSFAVAKNAGEQADLMLIYQYSLLLSGVYPTPVMVDFTAFSELMQNYVSLPLGELVSYHAQDKQQYGLTRPGTTLTIVYTDDAAEEREFTICFGGLNEEQTHYYVCLEDSGQTFLMEREKAEALLCADTFSIVDRYTQMVNITLLGGMNIAYGDAVRRVDITHTSETDESGKETIMDYFAVDGKKLNEEDEDEEFRTLYQHIIALKLTRELTEEDRVSGDAALTLEFLDKDGVGVLRSVRYLRLENSDQEFAVEVDGACLFAADAPSIEKVIGLLRDYEP